jgi:hypothetical protein
MSQKFEFQLLQTLFTDARFESMLRALDKLHDAASDGRLEDATPLNKAEVTAWLRELAYTAQETVRELEKADSTHSSDNYSGQMLIDLPMIMQERMATHVKANRNSGGT